MIWAVLAFFAAGAWTGNPWIGAGAAAVAYLVDVRLHPVTVCAWCKGDPRVRDTTGTSWRGCFWCSGTGRRGRLFGPRRHRL